MEKLKRKQVTTPAALG